MKRLDSPLTTCLHCGRARTEDDPGWETFEIGDATLLLCGRHAGAFAVGVEWADRMRRHKEAAERETPRQADQQADQQTRDAEGRRKRVEARLKRVWDFDMTPQDIHAHLSRFVVGQEEAKRTLSTALRTHYKRVKMRMIQEKGKRPPVDPDLIPKETLLVIGPTGCGKTHLLRTAGKIMDVPCHSVSMASFTEEGYVGDSVQSILSALVPLADNYIPLSQVSIVFLDEICKKARRAVGGGSYRDVSGEGVIQGLLAMLDTGGSKIHVPTQVTDRRSGSYAMVEFDTRDTFFVLGGAFSGLVDFIAADLGGRRRLGFGAVADTPRDAQLRESELLHMVKPHHIAQYGFSPEFCGRIGSIAVVDPLSLDDLRGIMLDVDDAVVKGQQARAELEGFALAFGEEAIDLICQRAYDSGMGARRLRSLTSEVLAAVFFEMPSGVKRKGTPPTVVVTAATVEDPTVYEVVRPTRVRAKAITPSNAEAVAAACALFEER